MTTGDDQDLHQFRGWDVPPWSVALAIGLTLAVIAAAVVVLGGGRDGSVPIAARDAPSLLSSPSDETTRTASSTSTTSTTTSTTSPASTSTTLPAGHVDQAGAIVTVSAVTVEIPRGSLDGAGVLEVARAEPSDQLDALFEFAGPVFDISIVGAELVGPVTITMPIDNAVGAAPAVLPDGTAIEEPPSVFMAHWVDKGWEVLETIVDLDSGTITATTTSLSLFGALRIAGSFVVELAQSLLEALTGGLYRNVPQPECGQGVDDRDRWSFDTPDLPVTWCAHLRNDDRRVVQVVNQRRYGITVSAPAGIITASSTDLASQLSGFATRDDVVALAPGDTATITYPPGTANATITSEYDGLAQSLTSLLVAADILAAIAARVPFSGIRDAQQFLRYLNVAGCLASLGVDVTAMVINAAGTIATLIRSCFDEVLRNSLGVIGAVLLSPLVVVASTIAYFMSSASATWDLISGGSRGRLALAAGQPAGDEPSNAERPSGSVWPAGDNEGPHTLYMYLGADFQFPDWVSCSASYCIVAVGDRVRLFDLNGGISDLGWIGIDHPDPVGEFIAAGLPADEVAAFMTPGPVPGGR